MRLRLTKWQRRLVRVLGSAILLAVLGIVFWSVEMPTGPGRWIGLILFGMGIGLAGIHAVLVSKALSRYARPLLSRGLQLVSDGIADKVARLARTTVSSYRMFGSATRRISLLSAARHAVGIGAFALVALSLDIHLSLLTLGWLRVVLQALVMLPISFSGIGVREGGLVILLEEYGVTPSDAVALAFLLLAITLLNNGVGGFFELKNLIRAGRKEPPATRSETQ